MILMAVVMAFSSIAPVIPAEAASGNMQITPIDFGDSGNWGDSTMISSGGKNLLMDTYIRDKYDTLINYLDDHHFYTFDIYLSHYHYDHMDQIPSILYDSRFNVSKVYLPDPAYLKKGAQSSSYCKSFLDGYNNIVKAANDTGTQIVYLKKGSSFTVGNAKVSILWGCSYSSSTYDASYINNNSLVAKVTSGTVSYLNCGDIEKQTENQILSSGINISADIFKFNHHGGNTSNTASFLKKVNPSFAYYNWVGDSPSSFGGGWVQSAIDGIKNTCNIYSTRYNGMLTFSVKAGHISVAGERNMNSVNVQIKDGSGRVVNTVNYQFNNALDYVVTASMRSSAATVAAADAATALPARYAYVAKFIETSGGIKYRNKDGSYSTNKFQKIDGDTYYFDQNGYRATGFKAIGGKTYYFDSDGVMLLRWKRINGKKYLFDPVDGHMHTGWEWVSEKNAWYYLSPQTGYLLEGWISDGGKKYYLTPVDFYAATGWKYINNKWYFFDKKNCDMKTGWLSDSGKTYYLASNGVMVTGKQSIGGRTYNFDSSGALIGEVSGQTGARTSGSGTSSGSASGGSSSGVSITPSWNYNIYTTSSHINSWYNGSDSDMPYDTSTKRNTAFVNTMIAYATYFVGKIDYASSVTGDDPNGLRYKKLRAGGKTDCSWYVYHVLYKFGLVGDEFIHSYEWGNDPSTYPGGVNIGTDVSKASPGDIICTGKGTSGSNSHVAIYIGGGKVVECAAGYGVIISSAPSTARQVVHFNCLPSNTTAPYKRASSGTWISSGSSWKFKVGGSYLTNCFQNIDGEIYYFDSNGLCAKGWKTIGGKKYYFNNDCQMLLRWKRIDGKKYYFDPVSGYMHTGWEWVAEKGAWYYLDPATGVMVTGTRTIDGKTYTFSSDGARQ